MMEEYKERSQLIDSLILLDLWIENNGWEGYDPYDIKATQLFKLFNKNKFTKFSSNILAKMFPLFLRKLLFVDKLENPKAMALFARGYLRIYRENNQKKYLEKALFCLNWLRRNHDKAYSGFSWGQSFEWQSRVFIPKGTPSTVITSIAAHAFLDAYEATNEIGFLEVAQGCCDFITTELNIYKQDVDKICFSKTPLDNFTVHNCNLFSAATLLRTYKHTKKEIFRELAQCAINFSMQYQNKDGSWYYWAPPNKLDHHIDNYHTGFVLECLNISRRVLGDKFSYETELNKGLDFYRENLFLKNGAPKIRVDQTYPIDIHSCAQGIITFSELSDFKTSCLNMAQKVANWTITNMQNPEKGFFYYRKFKHWTDKTPYIRWGEAWMLRALSYLI